MDPIRRPLFNAAFSNQAYARVMKKLEGQLGPIPFRIAETPVLLTRELRDALCADAKEIVAELSKPDLVARLRAAVPARYDVPGMGESPDVVLVDFALVHDAQGKLVGRVVELQAFASVTALMMYATDAWNEELQTMPGLQGRWSCFIDRSRESAVEMMRRTILGACDPKEVALIDITPEQQKTRPDFEATRQLFGVEYACVTDLVKQGRSLFRKSGGKLVPVKRLYNRVVFDELEVRGVKPPFDWTDDLDVSWCPHPNWYWMWSKHSLPFVNHRAIPKTWFLSDLAEVPADLTSRYVLKPVFSFAGANVNLEPTPADLARIPAEERGRWVIQEKITYAPVLSTPAGDPVKAELRFVLMRAPETLALTPLMAISRLSRGKMLGVDFNKGLEWVGGSCTIWPE